MTANNGWPNRPGVPRDPGLSGAHWLKGYTEDAWMYDGDGGWWGPGYSHNLDAETVAARYSYLGPVLSHDQATALQARIAELEAALKPFAERDLQDADYPWLIAQRAARAAIGEEGESNG